MWVYAYGALGIDPVPKNLINLSLRLNNKLADGCTGESRTYLQFSFTSNLVRCRVIMVIMAMMGIKPSQPPHTEGKRGGNQEGG